MTRKQNQPLHKLSKPNDEKDVYLISNYQYLIDLQRRWEKMSKAYFVSIAQDIMVIALFFPKFCIEKERGMKRE